MKLFFRTLAAALTLGIASCALAQDVKRAKLGHSFADAHPRTLAMKQFAAAVEKATGGKVAIDIYVVDKNAEAIGQDFVQAFDAEVKKFRSSRR